MLTGKVKITKLMLQQMQQHGKFLTRMMHSQLQLLILSMITKLQLHQETCLHLRFLTYFQVIKYQLDMVKRKSLMVQHLLKKLSSQALIFHTLQVV